jgi:uncharacterized oligopeptide transporter (OPT) family protein
MKIRNLNDRIHFDQKSRLNKRYLQFKELVTTLRATELNEGIVNTINRDIDSINLLLDVDTTFNKQLKNSQSKILKLIEKELKLVTKHHYRNMWFALGTGAFGVPIGIIIGIIIGNMAFIGIGIPFGFSIGLIIGTMMDQKSKEKGKQLDLEIKY